MLAKLKVVGGLGAALLLASVAGGGVIPTNPAEAGLLAAASPNYITGVTVQNLGTAAANISVSVTNDAGDVPASFIAAGCYPSGNFTDSVAVNAIYTPLRATDPIFKCLTSGAKYAFTINSDQPIAAVVLTQRSGSGSAGELLGSKGDPFRNSAAEGIPDSKTGSTLFVAQFPVDVGGFNASAFFQNTDSASSTAVVSAIDPVSGLAVSTQTITAKPFAAKEIKSKDAAWSAPGLTSGKSYALRLVSNNAAQKWAAAVIWANTGVDGAGAASPPNSQLESFQGASSGQGATTLFAPRLMRHFFNFEAGLTIVNVGTAATDVTITYSLNDGSTSSHTYSSQFGSNLAPGQPWGIFLGTANPANLPADLFGKSGVFGSATIVSTGQPLIGIGTINNPTTGAAGAYNLFSSAEATSKVFVPQYTKHSVVGNPAALTPKGGFFTGIAYQNVGSTPIANCTETYTDTGVTPNQVVVLNSGALAAGQPFARFSNGNNPVGPAALNDTFQATLVVDCGAGAKVVLVTEANVLSATANAQGNFPPLADSGDAYEVGVGINQ